MSGLLELASGIAREAGELSRSRFGQKREIETKSSSIDLVTDVDRACDALIRARIETARPDDAIVTEEADPRDGKSGVCWIVDPIDGTTNYAHGFPHYAISIGIELEGTRHVGVVYDPMKDELFAAERGAGASLNGDAIRVSQESELGRALLATGFAYDAHSGENTNLEYFSRFLRRAQAIRRAGSAALDLAYIACGRFDGFWELSLHPWDVAAGILLIEEAGGHTSDLDGGATPSQGERIVASNGRLHEQLLQVLSGA
ncbi:MAG: inositol monophosphatase [bacterium]|nr:inositol monophosphatase [bacterium]